MTDRLSDLHAEAEGLLSRLAARARDDLAGAAFPSAGDGPHVSSSGKSDPTGSTFDRLGQARDHQTVVRGFQQTVALLTRLEERLTPRATGMQCPTVARDDQTGELVACEGQATHFGTGRALCHRCDQWHTAPQNRGFVPDPDLIRSWNGRLSRDCGCRHDGCPHDPGGCLNRIGPGQPARTCGTCRNRKSKATRQEQTA